MTMGEGRGFHRFAARISEDEAFNLDLIRGLKKHFYTPVLSHQGEQKSIFSAYVNATIFVDWVPA